MLNKNDQSSEATQRMNEVVLNKLEEALVWHAENLAALEVIAHEYDKYRDTQARQFMREEVSQKVSLPVIEMTSLTVSIAQNLKELHAAMQSPQTTLSLNLGSLSPEVAEVLSTDTAGPLEMKIPQLQWPEARELFKFAATDKRPLILKVEGLSPECWAELAHSACHALELPYIAELPEAARLILEKAGYEGKIIGAGGVKLFP